MKSTNTHLFRVKPDTELVEAITEYCRNNKITSGIVTGMIGALQSATLGFLKALPGKYITKELTGPLEIVCAQGSVATFDGELTLHIHIMVSDEKQAVGGHLTKAVVFSTAEVAITALDQPVTRILDEYTGLKELNQ